MANARGTELHSTGYTRVPNTLLTKATPCLSEYCNKQFSNSRITRNDIGNKSDERPRGSRSSSAISKLSVHDFSGTQKRWVCPTHFQFKSPQLLCNNREIQSFERSPNTQLSSTQRLALQNRFISGIFSSKSISRSSKVFKTDLQERTAPNDMFAIWPEHSPKNLRCSYELGRTVPASAGYQNNRILGRFLNSGPRNWPTAGSSQSNSRGSGILGLDSKLRKVPSGSAEERHVFGHTVGPVDQSKKPTRGQNNKSLPQTDQNVGTRENNCQRASKPSGLSKLRQLCGPKRSITLSSPSEFLESRSQKEHHAVSPNPLRCTEQSDVVANELPRSITNSLSSTKPFSDDRCVRSSVGSSVRQPCSVRILDRRRASVALQPERNAGHFKSNKRSLSAPASIHGHGSVRQQDCHCLPQKRRRHQVVSAVEFDISSTPNSRPTPDSFEPVSFTRQVQCPRRSPLKVTTATRMASQTQLHGKGVHEMGLPCHRPFCIREISCGCQLRNTGFERSTSSISGCFFTNLELPVGLGIPSTISGAQGACPPEPGVRDLPSGGSQMGESILEIGSSQPSDSSTFHLMESRQGASRPIDRPASTQRQRDGARGLEVWGWTGDLLNWNDDQVQLLGSSWRPSTRKTYNVAWNRWLQWCQEKACNPICPSGSELAKFLADLHLIHRLSYNTILLHKSVVCTLCNVNLSGQLTSNVLVKHIMKSIALQKPKRQKPPIWNIDRLAQYLESCSVDLNSIFMVSRHTAMLLLLCSGRRIHDLTLLSSNAKHCVRSESSIVLWPIWGSKTDTSDYRQSGWKFLRNQTCQNLDPVFWINHLIELVNIQRRCSNTNNLFVTIRGDVKPASRTIIAGWIKSLLVEAGISATPGSVRSAVASRNFLDNFPLEDVLARGNWRSANTFKKYYMREVMPASSSNSVTMSFTPVDFSIVN